MFCCELRTADADPAVVAEAVALDGVSVFFKAVIQGRILEERLLPPQCAFPVLVDVLIFIDCRLVAQQHKNICVAAIRDGGTSSPDYKRNILGENARRLYRLDALSR